MFPKAKLSLLVVMLLLLAWVLLAQAQTATPPPPSATPASATPAPTEPPAILIITPVPEPEPPTPFFEEFWQEILVVLVGAGGVLVGLFLKQIAEKLAEWSGRLFHFLFDRLAAAPIVRLRYEKVYRRTLAEMVQTLHSGHVVKAKSLPTLRLDQMYVPTLLTLNPNPTVNELVDLFRTREDARRQQEKNSLDSWQAVRQHHRLVVLGEPGIGKTTYLYYLAFMCADRRRPEVQDHLPIYFRFADLVKDLPKLERLEDAFPDDLKSKNFPNAQKYLERQLKDGRCLILLDGLDEVPNEKDHQELIKLTQKFADQYVLGEKQKGRRNILIVSSRPYSYEHGQALTGFTKTAVMELNQPAIETFVHNWFGADQGKLATKLLQNLADNRRFMELARNPLLLTLILDHFEDELALPYRRTDLYESCVTRRVVLWNQKRGVYESLFTKYHMVPLLRALALHLFQNEKQRFLTYEELCIWVEKWAAGNLKMPAANLTPTMLLDEIIEATGLIQEWAIDRYGFSHKTFQEYFVADALAQLVAEESAMRLASYLTNPDWQEVILLYCSKAENAGPLLQRLADQANTADDSQPLWLLAGKCLAEGARQVALPVRQQVVAELVAMLRSPDTLTQDVREEIVDQLQTFAADLLPAQVETLLASAESSDVLLAQQLLPETGANEQQRHLIQERLAVLSRSGDREVRQATVAAFGRLGGGAESVAALWAGLRDGDAPVRAEAARACARLGQVDEALAEVLRQMWRDDAADDARHAALEALLALRREAEVGMVYVPAGEFRMGSDDGDKAADKNEKPQHSLYLPAYFMDRTPVTNAEYRRFMAAGGYANADYWREAIEAKRWIGGKYVDYDKTERAQPIYWHDQKWSGDDQPVVGVSWYEALAYARWAGKRLPTEAEWEKAARSADGRLYPWGAWQPDHANTKEMKLEKTTPVGQFSPKGDSPYGVADMAGNVWEWCSTRWGHDYPYNPDDGREDLSGGDNIGRLLRGGSWASDKDTARVAHRLRNYPRYWDYYWGFRCCCATSSLPLSGSEF